MKKFCAIFLALALLLSFAACNKPAPGGSGGEEEETTEAFVESNAGISGEGEYVYFGSYPQSRVDDEAILDELNDIDAEWISFEYPAGTQEMWYDFYSMSFTDGLETEKSDFMRYTDVELDGERYRGVTFDYYRPCYAIGKLLRSDYIENETSLPQKNNGYIPGETYWFRYEPLRWKVLDAGSGLVLCDNVIDCQPYLESPGDSDVMENDWENSYAREFLNGDFINTAFDEEERKIIGETTCINKGTAWAQYDNPVYGEGNHNETTDRIFLPSLKDMINPLYGFTPFTRYGYPEESAPSRSAGYTDYAAVQGLAENEDNDDEAADTACFFTRTPEEGEYFDAEYPISVVVNGIGFNGTGSDIIVYQISGIRPAMRINRLKDRVPQIEIPERPVPEPEESKYEYVTFGSYPQSEVKDEKILSALNGLDADWISYEYLSGTADEDGNYGEATRSDFMQFADVTYEGNKYRGVKIEDYRPGFPEDPHMTKVWDYQTDSDIDTPAGKAFGHGYDKGNTYWFLYEPLKWIVYDRESGVLLCNPVIDSQPFNDLVYRESQQYMFGKEQGHIIEGDETYRANDYAHCSLRKWLNDDFYNTAFSEDEKKLIAVSDLDVTVAGNPDYDDYVYDSVSDKVYLLTDEQAMDEEKGFGQNSFGVEARSTEYARCQGVETDGFYCYDAASWWLRNPRDNQTDVACMSFGGSSLYSFYWDEGWPDDPDYTGIGVRPAITVTDIDALEQ